MTKIVKHWEGRASRDARTARAAQRTPLPPKGSTGIGNPSAEALRDELEKQLARKVSKKPRVGYPRSSATGAHEGDETWRTQEGS